MNLENMNHAINIMKRAEAHDSLYMPNWQCRATHTYPSSMYREITEEAMHTCGNKACFAGHIAVSPEFIKSGGECSSASGGPIYGELFGVEAIQSWLEIPLHLARALVFGELTEVEEFSVIDEDYSEFYECKWDRVTAPMVIAKLELIKSGELV